MTQIIRLLELTFIRGIWIIFDNMTEILVYSDYDNNKICFIMMIVMYILSNMHDNVPKWRGIAIFLYKWCESMWSDASSPVCSINKYWHWLSCLYLFSIYSQRTPGSSHFLSMISTFSLNHQYIWEVFRILLFAGQAFFSELFLQLISLTIFVY